MHTPNRFLSCCAAALLAVLPVLAAGAPAPAATAPGVFALYAQNRAQGVPNYVTGDLLLIGYALAAREATRTLEDQVLRPGFADLVGALAAALAPPSAAAAPAAGPAPDPAVTAANRDYLALLQALLAGDQGDPRTALPAGAVRAEYDQVLAADGIRPSPRWGYPLDYGQFKPRGRYTETPALSGYFRAMRYAGALLFPVQGSAATGVTPETAARMTAQAVQLAGLLAADPGLAKRRAALEVPLGWRFGPGEDLSDADLLQVRTAHPRAAPADLARALLEHARATGHQPRILGAPVAADRLEPGLSARDVLTGWRLLPARYSADTAAFQRLVYDATGAYEGGAGPPPFGLAVIGGRPVKGYPSAVELLALLGSRPAAARLHQAGEDRFAGYPAAFDAARAILDGAGGLNGAQLAFLRAVLAAPADPAARDQAAAAFWTWQRYLDVLYAKASYTVSGKGLELDPERPGASLEPATDLYRALAVLVEAQRQGAGAAPGPWPEFARLLQRVLAISESLQPGAALPADDQAFLNGLDRRLLALGGGTVDAPIVVDVHVNPADGQVVEEATAAAAVVEQGAARGARLCHREFKQPLDRRLDDTAWRARLAAEAGGATDYGTEREAVR